MSVCQQDQQNETIPRNAIINFFQNKSEKENLKSIYIGKNELAITKEGHVVGTEEEIADCQFRILILAKTSFKNKSKIRWSADL